MKKWNINLEKLKSPNQIPKSAVSRPLCVSALEILLSSELSTKQIKTRRYSRQRHNKIVSKISKEIKKQTPKTQVKTEKAVRTRNGTREPDVVNKQTKQLHEVKTVPGFRNSWSKDYFVQHFPGRVYNGAWDYLNSFPDYKTAIIHFEDRKTKRTRSFEFSRDELINYGFDTWGTVKARKLQLFKRIKSRNFKADPILYQYIGFKKLINKRKHLLRQYKGNKKMVKTNSDRTIKTYLQPMEGSVMHIKHFFDASIGKTGAQRPKTVGDSNEIAGKLVNGPNLRIKLDLQYKDGVITGSPEPILAKKKLTPFELEAMLNEQSLTKKRRALQIWGGGKYWICWQTKNKIEWADLTVFDTEDRTITLTKDQDIYFSPVVRDFKNPFIIFKNADTTKQFVERFYNMVVSEDDLAKAFLAIPMRNSDRAQHVLLSIRPVSKEDMKLLSQIEDKLFTK